MSSSGVSSGSLETRSITNSRLLIARNLAHAGQDGKRRIDAKLLAGTLGEFALPRPILPANAVNLRFEVVAALISTACWRLNTINCRVRRAARLASLSICLIRICEALRAQAEPRGGRRNAPASAGKDVGRLRTCFVFPFGWFYPVSARLRGQSLLWWLIGGRDAGSASEFMEDLKARLASLVKLTTDAFQTEAVPPIRSLLTLAPNSLKADDP
jgi:hypothetical protein